MVGNHYEQVPIGTSSNSAGDIDDGFKGAYNGGGYTIRNVFYSTYIEESSYNINPKSQYVGLFRYAEYLWNINYEVLDDVTVTLENDDNNKDDNDPLKNGVKVGTLVGGDFRAWKCTATLNNLTVTVNRGDHAYVGALAGFNNRVQDCSTTITGCLKVTGAAAEFHIGGIQGIVYQEMLNCASKVNSLVVEGNANSSYYVGGLVGSFAHTNTGARLVSGCTVEIKDLRITGSTVKEGYAGGLVGYNNVDLIHEDAESTIYASYAVGAIGFGDTAANSHYSGFAGKNGVFKNTETNKTYKSIIQDCYSAVALPNKTTSHNFCSNGDGTFINCHYLNGSWTYGGQTCTALADEKITGVTGTDYAGLRSFTADEHLYQFIYHPAWGGERVYEYKIPEIKAKEGVDYPFPVSTTRPKKKIENGDIVYETDESGNIVYEYYYIGDDWPNKSPATVSAFASMPEVIEPMFEDFDPAPEVIDSLPEAIDPEDFDPTLEDFEPEVTEPEDFYSEPEVTEPASAVSAVMDPVSGAVSPVPEAIDPIPGAVDFMLDAIVPEPAPADPVPVSANPVPTSAEAEASERDRRRKRK